MLGVAGCFIVLSLLNSTGAKVYDRCELAQTLSGLGVPYDQLSNWDCIAQRESDYNTAAVGPENSDGSQDYGIFQINNFYWCQDDAGTESTNSCAIRCEDLLGDNVDIDVDCAQLVLQEQGWGAWSTWDYCQNNLLSVDNCF